LKYIKSAVLLILINISAFCQSQLFIPVEIQEAYEDGTRSLDGKPGADYWQNKSDYKINVSLHPTSGIISGSAEITYYNNSPDTLDRVVLRLYQNIYKKGSVRDLQFDEEAFTDGLILNSLVINNKNIDLKIDSIAENTGTNLIVKIVKILPKKKAKIDVTWNFKVSPSNLRMGQYDSTTFFIAYWYPQVAVYDDINGWDLNEYTGQTEFYNDFNNYDVKITVPNYFGVWATGELKNAEVVLSPQIYERYSDAMSSSTVINIITASDYLKRMAVFNIKNETNTWHYSANNVPDFTFGAAANYLWDGKSADGGNKKVFVSAVYKQSSKEFSEVCIMSAKTVEMLSKDFPGIPYPYPKITIFNGAGGVESPMMVNESSGNRRWLVYVTPHEVAHAYFPFYMGINEREYAWMDEGFTQMLPEYIQIILDTTVDRRQRNTVIYSTFAGKFDEVPMMSPSYLLKGEVYENHAYFRPAAALNVLKDFLGEDEFKKALAEYMKRWNGKHPTPYDFFFTFEDVTNDDLGWFWLPWFFRQGYPDLAIDTAFAGSDMLKIKITKEGELPIPAAINVRFKDGTEKKTYRSAAVWKSDEDEIWIEMQADKKISLIELGSPYIPDADTTNNYWIFK
jgi:hypothetical protein